MCAGGSKAPSAVEAGGAPEERPDGIVVPVVWVGAEEIPILFANAFVCQFDQTLDAFILTIGQITPPAFRPGTPEELRAQAEQIAYMPVKSVGRFVLTPARLLELVAALQANRDQLDEASRMAGDPR